MVFTFTRIIPRRPLVPIFKLILKDCGFLFSSKNKYGLKIIIKSMIEGGA